MVGRDSCETINDRALDDPLIITEGNNDQAAVR